jgi:hypothetical protein
MNGLAEMHDAGGPETGPDTLFFVHIPKTAGTTFQSILWQVYDAPGVCRVYPSWDQARDQVAASDPAVKARVVVGHYVYGLHCDPVMRPRIEDRVRYATFLRDPVDRVVSHYNHVMNSDLPLHREIFARHPTLESFLDHPWAWDVQAVFLTGWHRTTVRGDRPGAIRTAMENLRERFDAIGLTERFDESLAQFARAFGWRLPSYTSMNQASERAKRIHVEELSPALVAKIRDLTPCDTAIYEYGRSLFEERCAAASPATADDRSRAA